MTESALISSYTFVNSEFREDHSKLCFLWFDEIIFQSLGALNTDKFLEHISVSKYLPISMRNEIADVFQPIERKASQDLLDSYSAEEPVGYPRWGENYENYKFPEPLNCYEYAHNRLLDAIEMEKNVENFDGISVEYAEGRARAATETVRLWNYASQEFRSMLQANRDEKLAMGATIDFLAPEEPKDTAFTLLELTVPSLSNVPWEAIVDLKRDGAFERLKTKLTEIFAETNADLTNASAALQQIEEQTISQILDQYRPSTVRVAIEALLANLPGLPLNPVSVITGIRNTKNEIKKINDIGWFYVLRDLRSN